MYKVLYIYGTLYMCHTRCPEGRRCHKVLCKLHKRRRAVLYKVLYMVPYRLYMGQHGIDVTYRWLWPRSQTCSTSCTQLNPF